jgi:hypothetical protein
LTGSTEGVELDQLVSILGKERVIKRLKYSISKLKGDLNG